MRTEGQRLKKNLDRVCSEYVRRSYADWQGNVRCYTCDKQFHWKYTQCGHYVSRTYNNLRWDLRNLRPQCYSCNVMKRGNMDEFAFRLEQETPGILKELNTWKHRKATTLGVLDLKMLIDDFKSKLKLLST